ncbi:hypothetical protein SRB17_53630 [Streptomyces sp. RB17]|uniref:hypothetical protein n=1 Tax=Streptomyces sp. RB17 TaxID=2585197 RepID=UPI0012950B2C|nr:hypothetical protein [Streptomyces sp. RB17]MQY37359.1 hypothetical protein [Streptomyces sp. RB17]
MEHSDGHVHVEAQGDAAAVRNVIAATFGLVGTLSAEATTGCGLRVPRAHVSRHPERVTCLPCREHARDRHKRLADRLAGLAVRPGATADRARVERAAAHHRDLARRFAAP